MNSHFTFTRNNYDSCASDEKNVENKNQFSWMTDKIVVENSKQCLYKQSPYAQTPFHSIPNNIIMIEDELRRQKIPLTKCSAQKNNFTKYKYNWKDCSKELEPEYTRLYKSSSYHPNIDYVKRFTPIFEDVQSTSKIHKNSYIGENTRLMLKDAYVSHQ